MRIIEVKLYKFNELNEEAKKKALDKLQLINVEFNNWFDSDYEDANRVGIKITGFDLGRANSISLEFIEGAEEVAREILKEHGEGCDTFEAATNFLKDKDNLVYELSDKIETERVAEGNEEEFDERCDSLEEEFKKEIEACYFKQLHSSYEYLISEEAIKETIEANEYEFTEEGEKY